MIKHKSNKGKNTYIMINKNTIQTKNKKITKTIMKDHNIYNQYIYIYIYIQKNEQ